MGTKYEEEEEEEEGGREGGRRRRRGKSTLSGDYREEEDATFINVMSIHGQGGLQKKFKSHISSCDS